MKMNMVVGKTVHYTDETEQMLLRVANEIYDGELLPENIRVEPILDEKGNETEVSLFRLQGVTPKARPDIDIAIESADEPEDWEVNYMQGYSVVWEGYQTLVFTDKETSWEDLHDPERAEMASNEGYIRCEVLFRTPEEMQREIDEAKARGEYPDEE